MSAQIDVDRVLAELKAIVAVAAEAQQQSTMVKSCAQAVTQRKALAVQLTSIYFLRVAPINYTSMTAKKKSD